MIRKLSAALLLSTALVSPAAADIAVTPGSGATIFDFTCFTTKHCPAAVPVDSTGAALGVSGNPFSVTFPSAQAVTVSSGTVTANAGTNLNTSLLALETGGNLATLAGTVTSNRAAVNPISGQAGVQGGAGASTALTQRVAIATDANAISGTVTVTGVATAANQTSVIGTKNAGTAATNSLLAGGVFNSTPLTLTDTQQASLQTDANGFLKVNVAAGGASGGTSSSFGSGFPGTGTAVGFSDGTNMVAAKVGAITNVTAATNLLNVNPGCQYNATPVTVTDTRYQGIQCDVNGFLKVNVASATGLAQGSTTSGQTGSLIMAAVTTAAPSYTTAQTSPLSLDTAGNLRVSTGTVTVTATNLSTNLAQVNGNTTLTGNGVTGTGSARVTIASDNTAFSVNAQPLPTTTGGLSTFFLQPAASDNHTNIKNGAGQVYHVSVTNNSATINYLRLYNAATGFNGCNSATNLIYQLAIPASTSGAGFVQDIAMGIPFSTGISACVTSGYATTDTTNATASAMSLLVAYK